MSLRCGGGHRQPSLHSAPFRSSEPSPCRCQRSADKTQQCQERRDYVNGASSRRHVGLGVVRFRGRSSSTGRQGRKVRQCRWCRSWYYVRSGRAAKPGFMEKHTEEPREPTATTEQQTSHEPNAATQHLSTDSTQGDRHRRAGTRFKFRHKPRGPNTRSHDHCPSSHVDLHLPTCALLLAGLLATCVGNVPVEASPSSAWIARPSRKMLSAKTTPHSADALGNAQCIVTNVSASAGDSSVNQHPPIKLSQQEIVRGRTPAPPPRLPEPSPAQLKAWPPPPPPRPINPDAASKPRRPQRAALHPASTFPDDNSRQSPLPGPPRIATSISDLIGWLAGARHRLEDTVQRAAAAIAKVPWARPKYPKKKQRKLSE